MLPPHRRPGRPRGGAGRTSGRGGGGSVGGETGDGEWRVPGEVAIGPRTRRMGEEWNWAEAGEPCRVPVRRGARLPPASSLGGVG